ncbi:MAG: hypothetical protein IJ449_10685 [Clostridia bacterium]|nr:hypothetical protein [Clostridia bacterium]
MSRKKQKYADTIRRKAEAAPPTKTPTEELSKNEQLPLFRLNRFNRLFWPLVISPLFTLLYSPVNRYVMLPKLGSGEVYTDMDGNLVEDYFSANSMARVLFWILLALTELLLIRCLRHVRGWKKIPVIFLGTVMNLVVGMFFLEFTLWS